MADPDDPKREGAPRHIHIERDKKFNWLPWLLLALGLLALLFAMSRCDRDDTAAVAPAPTETGEVVAETPSTVVATTPNAATSSALAGTAALGGFLAGTEAAPRTFTFEKLNFDTGKSDVRAPDAAEVNQVATTLKQYGTARIRIAGYADARGSDQANMALGKARAEAIRSSLIAQGVDAGRIESVSGGESDPVDSNATATGRFENRRTELVVTAR